MNNLSFILLTIIFGMLDARDKRMNKTEAPNLIEFIKGTLCT